MVSAQPPHGVHDSSPEGADRRAGLTRRELTRRALLVGALLAVDPSLVGSPAVAAEAPGASAATFAALVDALEPGRTGPAALDRASDVFAAAYASWDPAVRSFADQTLAELERAPAKGSFSALPRGERRAVLDSALVGELVDFGPVEDFHQWIDAQAANVRETARGDLQAQLTQGPIAALRRRTLAGTGPPEELLIPRAADGSVPDYDQLPPDDTLPDEQPDPPPPVLSEPERRDKAIRDAAALAESLLAGPPDPAGLEDPEPEAEPG